jgi:hypothetical protein
MSHLSDLGPGTAKADEATEFWRAFEKETGETVEARSDMFAWLARRAFPRFSIVTRG